MAKAAGAQHLVPICKRNSMARVGNSRDGEWVDIVATGFLEVVGETSILCATFSAIRGAASRYRPAKLERL